MERRLHREHPIKKTHIRMVAFSRTQFLQEMGVTLGCTVHSHQSRQIKKGGHISSPLDVTWYRVYQVHGPAEAGGASSTSTCMAKPVPS